MNRRPVLIALAVVVLGVVLQTTMFGDGRIQPFGASSLLVLAIVIAAVRYLDPEPALLLGFTGGLLLDLLGGSPLGLWAIVYLIVAYIVLRIRVRFDDGAPVIGVSVFLLTLLAQGLFLLESTLFGQRLLTTNGIMKQLFLPALYTTLVAAAVVPLMTRLLREQTMGSWLR